MTEFEKVQDIAWQRLTNEELNQVSEQIRMARAFLTARSIRNFVVGDRVEWVGRKGRQVGTIKKVNRKRVEVMTDTFQSWTVPANMLKAA